MNLNDSRLSRMALVFWNKKNIK